MGRGFFYCPTAEGLQEITTPCVAEHLAQVAHPCSMSPYLDRLGVSPHHALPIALPDKVHFPPCPRRGDAQLHLEPARLPPGREQAATSAHPKTFSGGNPHSLRASMEKAERGQHASSM